MSESKRKPKVSVCMPVYNGEKYLRQAIESILAQSFDDFELVIADDCSTDSSYEIIEEYAAKDKRVRAWRNENNLGLFGNWNLTMQKGEGDYIKPFAQDDFCKPALLERLAAALDENPGVSLSGCAREQLNCDEHGERRVAVMPDARKYYRDRIFPGRDVSLMFLLHGDNLVGFPPAVMFRREHLDRGGFDSRYYHCGDVEFFIRLLKKGDYYFVYKPLVTYRYHGQNQTHKNFAELKYMSDILLLQEDYGNFVRESGIENYDEIVADLLTSVITIGRDTLGIDYSQVKSAEVLSDTNKAVRIIVALANRVEQLKGTLDSSLTEAGRDDLERVSAEREELRQANQALNIQINSIVNSTSWKITKPIRAVKRLVAKS